MRGVAEEEVRVVEQLRAVEELLVAGEPEEPRHDFVHAAVLAGDVAVPHADARLRRKRLQPRVRPRAHAPRDVERLLVARDLVAVEQTREDLVQRVVRRPDLRVLRAVGGALLEHDELIRRVRADEPDAPVPVVRADRALPEIRVVARAPGGRGNGRRIGHGRARLASPADLISATGRTACRSGSSSSAGSSHAAPRRRSCWRRPARSPTGSGRSHVRAAASSGCPSLRAAWRRRAAAARTRP